MTEARPPADAPRRARRTRGRLLSVGLSLAVHAGLLLALALLVVPARPAAPESSALARVEFVEPHAPEDELLPPPPLDHTPPWDDLRVEPPAPFVPFVARLEEFELPAEGVIEMDGPRIELPEVPIHAVRPRPGPPQAEAPPAAPPTPAPPPPAVASRRNGLLRVVYRPPVLRYYPLEARRRGIEGTAIVQIRVDERGVVVEARIEQSSGSSLLDRQALRMMYDHRFAPGLGGRARRPVEFRLE